MKNTRNPRIGQISDTDIRLLRTFKSVVDCIGFTSAAAELNVTRSAISASMSDLETRLGMKLCNRGRSGFSLTESGRMVYKYTDELLEYLSCFREKVNLIHDSLTGNISIGVVDTLITSKHMRIVNSLARLKSDAPDVHINMSAMPPNHVERGVLNGELDIGIIPEKQEIYGLNILEMYSEKIGLYCGERHSLFDASDSEVEKVNLFDLDMAALEHPLTRDVEELYKDHKISATVSDGESLSFLIMTGCYVGFLPENFANLWVSKGLFRQLLPNKLGFKVNYVAVSNYNADSSPIIDTYLKILSSS
ncbi:MAG: LysR family transcriptional regulator [Pseudomonadota bacterium]